MFSCRFYERDSCSNNVRVLMQIVLMNRSLAARVRGVQASLVTTGGQGSGLVRWQDTLRLRDARLCCVSGAGGGWLLAWYAYPAARALGWSSGLFGVAGLVGAGSVVSVIA